MPRLFAGIEIPPEVAADLGRLKQPMAGARWIEPDDMHLTLRFAGDIENHVAAEFADALSAIHCRPFELMLEGAGVFGGREPRSLWAGVAPCRELEALARACERAARNAGLPPESRAFKPHVTLARLQSTEPDRVARYLTRHGGFRSRPFTVERLVLFSSRPRTGGGPYVAESVFPFEGTAFDWDGEPGHWGP